MKRVLLAAVALVLLAACAAASHHAVQTSPPGSWTWYAPDEGYVWYTPGPDGGAGVWTWARSSSSTPPPTPRHFGAAPPASWAWVAFNDAAFGSLATSAGYLFDIHCSLTTLGAGQPAPVYVMGFDTNALTQPTNGTAPIVGVVSGGLSAVGNDVSYGDEQYAHGVVNFQNGFMLAVSNTADTYTGPSAGTQVQCSAKLSARR